MLNAVASKFNNTWTKWNGRNFQSKMECERAKVLVQMVADGQISNLEYQPVFVFKVHGSIVKYPSGRDMKYVGDFRYQEGAMTIVEDVKGAVTDLWRSKWALAKAHYPGTCFKASRFKKGEWVLSQH